MSTVLKGITLIGYFGLLTLMMSWPTLLTSDHRFPVALLLIITVTPLLPLLWGLMSFRPKALAWSGFISLPYFIHGTTEFFADPADRWLSAAEICFSLMLFFGSALTLRLNRG